MVSQGGMFEVKAGQLAAEQGSTQDIKRLRGRPKHHDHQLVGDKLKAIASDNGLPMHRRARRAIPDGCSTT